MIGADEPLSMMSIYTGRNRVGLKINQQAPKVTVQAICRSIYYFLYRGREERSLGSAYFCGRRRRVAGGAPKEAPKNSGRRTKRGAEE